MFKFGWLTITADDLAIWQKYPTAAFTLYSTTVATAPGTADETVERSQRPPSRESSPAGVLCRRKQRSQALRRRRCNRTLRERLQPLQRQKKESRPAGLPQL